jgi:iron complex outermembrane receptor protein
MKASELSGKHPKKGMTHKSRLSVSVSTALGLTALISTPVFAQDEQSTDVVEMLLEEVVVTGSRIPSEDGFGQTSPVAVVDMDAISSYGLTRIEEVLNNLPQIEASNTAFDSNDATGTASIDLRGLGANRTLVLLNGRRIQPGGINTEAVDVNQIPTTMIERVEVLTGGASATYGADAVAGVVNFIMRRINGVEVSAGISAYQHNNDNKYMQGLMDERDFEYPTGSTGFDGSAYNIEIAMGSDFADGRGNATAYVTWRQNASLLLGARDYSSCALNVDGNRCGGSATAEVPNFDIYALDADGNLDASISEFMTLQPDSSLLPFDGSNFYNFAPINFYMRPQENWTAGAFVDFEINEHAVVYTEIMLAGNDSDAQRAESGTFFVEAYDLPVDNALFPAAFQASLSELFPGQDRLGIYIGKRNTEGGPRSDILTYSSFRVVAGVKGIINDDWDYDVSYLHSKSNSSATYINDFLAPRIAVAVNATLCAEDSSCIPYEVFTFQGVSPAAAASLGGSAIGTNRTTLDVFEALITGDTGFGLPAGNIMMAGGYQWLQTRYDSVFDYLYNQGLLLGQGGPRQNVSGVVRVNELFVEGSVPLLADAPFAQAMTLDLAYRWSDYSTTGANSTYRVGIDWQVVDMLRVRTGYNRAVRAPSVAELFSPTSEGLWSGVDPCATATPVLTEAQCAKTGVQPGQYGNIAASPTSQYNALYGGNVNLGVEVAKTFTFGVVVNPMDTMQFSVDYWDIQIDDTISNVQPEISLNQCGLNGGVLCGNINRGINGTLWLGQSGIVNSLTQNIGSQKWSGIDLAWTWGIGDNWNLDLIGTYSLKKETTPLPDDPSSAYDCQGTASFICYPNPKWRHTATGTYDSNSWWAITARWRYYGAVDQTAGLDPIANDERAQYYIDLNGVIRFMDTNDLVFGVNNVFDREPPLRGPLGFWDPLGRFLFANVTFRW